MVAVGTELTEHCLDPLLPMLDVQNKPSKHYLGRIDAVQYHAGDAV